MSSMSNSTEFAATVQGGVTREAALVESTDLAAKTMLTCGITVGQDASAARSPWFRAALFPAVPGSTSAEGVAAREGKLYGAVGAGLTQGLLAEAPDLG